MTRRRQIRNQRAYWDRHPGLFDIASDSTDHDTLQPLSDADLAQPERLRYISFGSGSSGNCAYLGTPTCGILIDAGVDNNYVEAQLVTNSIDPDTIGGIILTHDHSDHIRYAYALLRRHRNMKLYATPKAFNGILRRHSMSRRIKDYHVPIYKEFPFTVGTLKVTAFETSHDGSDNAGFYIEGAGTSFVVATDTGTITARADHYIRQASHLMIESNYDEHMLRTGRYPQHLKARIASTSGHMDNADTARYLASVITATPLQNIFLCHLSQDNNTPQLALTAVRTALEAAGTMITTDTGRREGYIRLHILPRLESSPMLVL